MSLSTGPNIWPSKVAKGCKTGEAPDQGVQQRHEANREFGKGQAELRQAQPLLRLRPVPGSAR